MSFLQSLILGALQGITEFLPVSSSGHLVVMREVMEIKAVPPLYDVLLHIATLFVVIIVFRKRIGSILISLFRFFTGKKEEADAENLRLTLVILVATFFTAIVGLGISFLDVGRFPKLVSALFIVTGLILLFARFGKGNMGYDKIGVKHGIITGIAQGLGVLPGISRSGITISASLVSGMNREKAGEYSFLISLPAILGALILTLKDSGDLVSSVSPGVMAAGFITAFLVGLGSLLVLLRLIKSGKLYLFCFYLIPLGIAGLLFL